MADEQGELNKIAPQLDALQAQLKKDVVDDLLNAKEEVMFLLQEEVAGRLFLEKGQLEASFSSDKEVEKAIEVLSDPGLLTATLGMNN